MKVKIQANILFLFSMFDFLIRTGIKAYAQSINLSAPSHLQFPFIQNFLKDASQSWAY